MKKCTSVALALALLLTGQAEAGPLRLRLKGGITGGTPTPTPVMPANQTVYWGSMTPNGYGGHKLGCNGCAYPLSISSGDTNNWQIIDSDGDGLGDQLAPRQTASATYASVRTVALAGSYGLVVSDALGRASNVTVSVDDGRAGKYTITNRDNIDTDGGVVTTQNQLRRIMAVAQYGETVGLRNGMMLNQPENGGTLKGTISLRIRGAARGTFTGSNWVVVRPETGGAALIGPITVDDEAAGNRINGTSFQNITFRSPPSVRPSQPILASLGNTRDIELANNVFTSGPDASGILQATGVTTGANSFAWIARSNFFYQLSNGLYLSSAPGNSGMTSADYSDPTGRAHTVTDNVFAEIGQDTMDAPCASGGVYSRNLVYDKVGAVNYGPTGAITNGSGKNYVNPFDALYQPHADGLQFDYSQCYYGRYAGPTIEDNTFLRGNGRDTLPFWTTAAGYPNPNLPSAYGSPTTGIPTTLDTSLGLYDLQSIFASQTQASGTVRAGYAAIVENVVIRRNSIQQTYANGITWPGARDITVMFNSVTTDYPGPTNLTGTAANIRLVEQYGTATVQYNIMSGPINFTTSTGATLAAGTGSGTGGTTNFEVGLTAASYVGYFAAPAPKRRTFGEFGAAFTPLVGQLRPGGGYIAGAIGPTGALNTMSPYP